MPADDRERDLQADHEEDRRGCLPAGLDLRLVHVGVVVGHEDIVAPAAPCSSASRVQGFE